MEAAATCADVPFTFGQTTVGRISAEDEPGTATVAGLDVFSLLSDVDLLKVDIEGAEWPILSDLRLADLRVPVVMFEYHPYGAPSANPEERFSGRCGPPAMSQCRFTVLRMEQALYGVGEPDGQKASC